MKKYSLDQSPFYKMQKEKDLAFILNISRSELRKIPNLIDEKYFYEFDIKNQNKVRHIEVPIKQLRAIHKRIKILLSRIIAPDFLFCPVKGKSYISNAGECK